MRLFDELGGFYGIDLMSIEDYFDEMNLSEEEKNKRKAFSREFLEAMLFIFSLISVMQEKSYIDKKYAIQQMQSKYFELTKKYGIESDDYVNDYIYNFSEEIIGITFNHVDEEYFLSNERALIISENESNSIFNYNQYSDARINGKTRKRWVTEGDNKVRKTHKQVDLEIIPIEDTFVIGNSLMRFPKDEYYNPEPQEVCGCRCTIEYF